MNLWPVFGYSQTPILLDSTLRKSAWTYLNTEDQRSRRPWLLDEVRRQVILIPVLLLICIMLLLALVVMSMSKDVLHDSLEFSPVEIRLDHPVCPYTIVEADRVLHISEPLVARVYTTVMDDVSKEDIERIERPVVINPSAEGKTVDMGINFVVPEYPPGRYAKTTAAVAEGTHAAFSTVYFEVSAICGQGESNESSQ